MGVRIDYVTGFADCKVVRVREEELGRIFPLEEYVGDTWRSQIAQKGVMSCGPACVVGVLETMHDGVNRDLYPFPEAFLYFPGMKSDRDCVGVNDSGSVNRVSVPVIEVAAESGSRGTILAVLVGYRILCRECAAHENQYRCNKYLFHNGAKIQ